MNKFIEQIIGVLKKDKRLFSKDDNKLLKGKLISLITKDDEKLLDLLVSNKEVEKRFFKKVGKLTIFQKENFLQLITMNEFLPDSFTAFEVKIGLSGNRKLISSQEDISLVFPHKDCILEGGQDKDDVKREEIFYNTTLAPDEIDRLKESKVLTNWKKFDNNGEHNIKDISVKENLVIKGNNLLALYSLLPNYRNKVKLIYIDPPYNTDNDSFNYNDSFNHSSWLTFMKNRLEVARELLSENGVIFVQCDDNEQAYLKVLMDEVFEKGFINTIAIKMSEATGVKMSHAKLRFPKIKEYILFYKKKNFDGFVSIDKYRHSAWDKENNIFLENFTKEQRDRLIEMEEKENNDEQDVKEAIDILKNVKKISLSKKIKELKLSDINKIEEWQFKNSYRIIKTAGSSSLAKIVKSLSDIPNQDISVALSRRNVLFFYLTDFNLNTNDPRLRVIFADSNIYKNPCDFWQDIKTSGAIANEGGVKLDNGKKPEKILHRLLKMITNEGDLVLDFFAGSGTTGAVAHKMNRQYILIEQMDYIHDLPEARLKNVISGDQTGISKDVDWKGGGSFVYTELLEWNNKYIRDLESAKTKADIKKIKAKIEKEAFYKYQIDTSKFDNKEFDKLSEKEQKEVLIDVLDMNHLYVNIDSINDATFAVSKEDKELNKKFYNQK